MADFSSDISVIALNVNGWNTPTEAKKLTEWV